VPAVALAVLVSAAAREGVAAKTGGAPMVMMMSKHFYDPSLIYRDFRYIADWIECKGFLDIS
jgi:hypothetical protein